MRGSKGEVRGSEGRDISSYNMVEDEVREGKEGDIEAFDKEKEGRQVVCEGMMGVRGES